MNNYTTTACRLVLLCLGLAACAAGASGGTSQPIPFEIHYEVRVIGFGKGESTVELEQHNDRWMYRFDVTPKGILALLPGDTVKIHARMRYEDRRLISEEYTQEHSRLTDKNLRYRFGADGHSVEVLKKGKMHFLHIPEGTLDEAAAQLQLTYDAARRDRPWERTVVAGGRLKRYRFQKAGTETIDTALGRINALRIERIRLRSSGTREMDHRYWLSPTHHYLPVRVERIKKDTVTRILTVKALRLGARDHHLPD